MKYPNEFIIEESMDPTGNGVYRNIPFEIWHDNDSYNPFEENESSVYCMAKMSRSTNDYSNGVITEIVGTDNFDKLKKKAKKLGLTYYQGVSKGYSQGEYADVFFLVTHAWLENTGVKKENINDEFWEQQLDLFSNWAWRSVYGFTVYLPDETTESVGSFFGFNQNESGLISYLTDVIDSYLDAINLKRQLKLKSLIKSNVPYIYRKEILNEIK